MKFLIPLFFLTVFSQAATIGYWRFEEGPSGGVATSVLDSSTNLNPGTPSGGPTYSPTVPADFTGPSNTLSLALDGANDTVIVPNTGALDDGAFTVEFWMRAAAGGSGLDLLVDKSHGFGDSTGWFFQADVGTGLVGFGGGAGGGGSSNFPSIASLASVYDNEWHHLAGTYDGVGQFEFFVDGVSQGTENTVYVGNTRELRFGSARNNGRFFQGNLDEIRISDEVLQPSQFLTSVPEPSSVTFLALLFLGGVMKRRR